LSAQVAINPLYDARSLPAEVTRFRPEITHNRGILALDVDRRFRYNFAFQGTVPAVHFYLLDLFFDQRLRTCTR
jgi:hypothetical protein